MKTKKNSVKSSVMRKGWVHEPTGEARTQKQEQEHPCFIQIEDSKYSNGNKEIVAIATEDFLIKHSKVYSDGYNDTHSSLLREHLEIEFPMYAWHKNSSQNPFDVYSVDAKVAIENKSHNVSGRKRLKGFSKNKRLVTNATIYASEAKVRDVVPKNKHHRYDDATLESFMDVLVIVADKDKKTNCLVRYRIVDGSYWEVDYDTYVGCREFFRLINNDVLLKKFLGTIAKEFPNNKFVSRLLDGSLPKVYLSLRKLISVENPTLED